MDRTAKQAYRIWCKIFRCYQAIKF